MEEIDFRRSPTSRGVDAAGAALVVSWVRCGRVSMRWLQAGVVFLSIKAMTGCPSEFGKDGRVAKAVHKDAHENMLELTRCSQALRDAVCGDGPNKNPDECKKCGGP
jgi:hypothetical protein